MSLKHVTVDRVVQTSPRARLPGGVASRLQVYAEGNAPLFVDPLWVIERPWLGNRPMESCIPAGTYMLKLGRYNRGGYAAYEIMDVRDRTLIKQHIANFPTDVLGCQGIGERFGILRGELAVLRSRIAFERYMVALDGDDEATIRISWAA